MTKYEDILANLKQIDIQQAEMMEEEIDIMIHKLKFLPQESFPKVIILDQKTDLKPIYSLVLAEKIKIAGGVLVNELVENPSFILILETGDNLYSLLPEFLSNINKETLAIKNNQIYLIQSTDFDQDDSTYLRDLEVIADIIQPKFFYFGRDGKDWYKFDYQV